MAIIHTDRVLHPERKRILWIVIRGWQWCGFCCTLHTSVIYIFNILLLKIVRSTDTEGRQSNKESVIWRGGNEKGSHFVICKSLFFFSSHYWCRSQRLVNPCSGYFVSVYLPAGTKREFPLTLPSLTGPLLDEMGEATTGFNPSLTVFLLLILKEWWRAQSEEQGRRLGTVAMLFLQLWVNSWGIGDESLRSWNFQDWAVCQQRTDGRKHIKVKELTRHILTMRLHVDDYRPDSFQPEPTMANSLCLDEPQEASTQN